MHNQEYISSGILELYAAGGLTQEEMEAVEARASASPEIKAALDEACEAMEAYAGLYAVKPRPALKGRILQQLSTSDNLETDNQVNDVETPLYPLARDNEGVSAYRWMFAASVTLLLLSGWLSIHFYNKWQQAEQRLSGLIASEQQLAQNYRTTTLQVQQQEKVLSVLRNPAYKLVSLQGVEAHPEASMLVYWNPNQQEVYVDQLALPAAPAGKQYQLWALHNGKPIDAGVLETADTNGNLQQMKHIAAADAFAVTLEPTGGSKEPTLEQLTVMGKI